MDIRRTRRGTTIRLTDNETTELLTSLALSMAAYGILQNFMTAAQKGMTLPSMLFVAKLGAETNRVREEDDASEASPLVPDTRPVANG